MKYMFTQSDSKMLETARIQTRPAPLADDKPVVHVVDDDVSMREALEASPVTVVERLFSHEETRMRLRACLAVIGLVVPAMASAQQPMSPNRPPPPFHPSMVEVGEVSPQEPHVTFDPPFQSTPKVVLSIKDQTVGGTYRGCGVEAKNITITGFDYFPACSARRPGGPLPVPVNLTAIWIATLQQ